MKSYSFFWVIPWRLNFRCRGITQEKVYTTFEIRRKFEIKNPKVHYQVPNRPPIITVVN